MKTNSPLYAQPAFRKIAGKAWRPGGPELTCHALALCDFAPGALVGDVGCGTGLSVRLLEKRGLRGVGIDRHVAEMDTATRCVCADAEELPFKKSSLDGILCECVLSLLSDAERALHGFQEVVRPGGLLLLTDIYRLPNSHAKTVQATEQTDTHGTDSGSSCLQGAVPQEKLEQLVREQFGTICFFEDHSLALKQLAAQLLWYGDDSLCAKGLLCAKDTLCSNDTNRSHRSMPSPKPRQRFGYGLWIARRAFSR